jgi:hypothetical protein
VEIENQIAPQPTNKNTSRSIAVAVVLIGGLAWACSGSGEATPEDRAPYAEVACKDFAKDQGYVVMGNETTNITYKTYTVQLQVEGRPRVSCVVEDQGNGWRLIGLR